MVQLHDSELIAKAVMAMIEVIADGFELSWLLWATNSSDKFLWNHEITPV